MRVTLLSRYPRVDTVAWKRRLAERLAAEGHELSVVYSRATLRDQVEAGLSEFGLAGVARKYADRRPGRGDGDGDGQPSLAAWARERGFAVSEHRRLGDADAVRALRAMAPDVVVLAGADIVPASILAVPRTVTINPHYGLLPRYRGMNVTEWSIFHDDPVGVTVHAVDPGIDTGDLLLQDTIVVDRGETLESLRAKHQEAAERLLGEAVARLAAGELPRVAQRPEDGRQFYRMHPALRQRVEAALSDGTYRWVGEAPPPPMLASADAS